MRITNRNSGAKQTLPHINGGLTKAVNSGFAGTAQKAIDTLAVAAADKSRNAIAVDSFEVNLYRYGPGSIKCTCKERSSPLENPAEEDPHETGLHIHDELSPEYQTPSGLTTKAVVNLRPDGLDDEHMLYKDDLPSRNQPPLQQPGVTFDNELSDKPEQNLDDLPFISLFPSMDEKACGLCGGSGFIDTYRWASGMRLLLLPRHADLGSHATINTSTRPYSIDIRGPNYVRWTVRIPAYFEQLDVWRVRDNVENEGQVRLTVDLTGTGNGPWQKLSTSIFDTLKGTGGKVMIQATAWQADNDDITMFTHGELFLLLTRRPRAQFPQLDRDLSASSVESLINTQFEIDPAVGAMSRQTLIEAIGQSRMWFVTQITNKQTTRGFVFNIGGQVQVVQPAMALYALSMFPRFVQTNPQSWRGDIWQAPKGLPDGERDFPYTENDVDERL